MARRGCAWLGALLLSLSATHICAVSLVVAQGPQAPVRRGTLVLEGTHPGAEAYIDGELVGSLPLEPVPLEVGEHTVRVTLAGFTEYSDVVVITRNRTTRVTVDLLPISTVVSVTTEPPGAQVFVDGRFAGETPVDIDVLEGQHSLRIQRAGYRELIRSVTALPGQREVLELRLEALTQDELLAISERRAPPKWYERPVTWVIVGASAVAVAAGVILAVAVSADEPSKASRFCEPGCVQFSPDD